MIMPSDDELRAGHGNVGNVTQPFVTETYRCVAPYETKDTKNKPFKVAVDEKVDVLIKDKAGERPVTRLEVDLVTSNPLRPVKRVVASVQGGGSWRRKTSAWPGSLRPIWRSWMKMRMRTA